LSEIRRVLKPNGVFINVVFTPENIDNFECTEYGYSAYSLEDLKQAGMQNNFEITDVQEIKNRSYCLIFKKIN